MKRIFAIFLTLFIGIGIAQAQTVENDLVGLGMAPELADYLAGIIPAGAALDNNVTLKSDNQAGGGTVDLLKADTSDNTVLMSDEADILITVSGTGDDIIATAIDDIVLQTQGSGDIITMAGGGTTVDLTIADNMVTLASGTELTLGGDIISTQTNIGATVATGANTACNTTCAVANGACVFGWDTSGTQSTNVACDGATADECLCLAAS